MRDFFCFLRDLSTDVGRDLGFFTSPSSYELSPSSSTSISTPPSLLLCPDPFSSPSLLLMFVPLLVWLVGFRTPSLRFRS